ncbi:BCD family MFS transporter [Pararhodospirillum oryzae]|uniref:MFS transporter n=1 Tax=Pararhodospirillum oryzae TaxID=478448 RepID=A0A512H507_9PROT|nr:BCD family MFS transporter [Pararhodospirillum oryzae]GEO80521.1 MFS transporter [Pararhodospirillum oryzae]
MTRETRSRILAQLWVRRAQQAARQIDVDGLKQRLGTMVGDRGLETLGDIGRRSDETVRRWAAKADSLARRVQKSEPGQEKTGTDGVSSTEDATSGPLPLGGASSFADLGRVLGDRLQSRLNGWAEKANDLAAIVQGPAAHGGDINDPLMDKVRKAGGTMSDQWQTLAPKYLPFADAASDDLPLNRLLRLSLFQISVGMAMVLLTGTLNRVMVVEMGVPTWLVATMVSLPILFAPFRVLIGFKSDTYRSFLGWRRVPFIWMGSLAQFGGLALMPFALFLLSGDGRVVGSGLAGYVGAALAFLLVGIGLHTTQTAGLALATDLAPEKSRPRVVALLYVMLLVGMMGSSVMFGLLLEDFTQVKLIQVIQGAAVVTMILNMIALWKQEVRNTVLTDPTVAQPSFAETWAAFYEKGQPLRLLLGLGIGTAAFSMQDVLLEPYGGQVLGLSVSGTTVLTAMLAAGTLAGFALAAKLLDRGTDPIRLASVGAVIGMAAFVCVLIATPMSSLMVFRVGTVLIGLGSGLFAVGMLTAAMSLADDGDAGLALGAWGAVQATAMGGGTLVGGFIRDMVTALAGYGGLGHSPAASYAGYGVVYLIEIVLLIATLAVLFPLARDGLAGRKRSRDRFGLTGFPG